MLLRHVVIEYTPFMALNTVEPLNKFPRRTLVDCLRLGLILMENIGSTMVTAETVATTLGYSTLKNGAAATALGSLRQYGIIDRPWGKEISISASLVAFKQTNDVEVLKEMAWRPRVFQMLRDGKFESCTDDVAKKHLEGQGLTVRAAREAVEIFRSNLRFLENPILVPDQVTIALVDPKFATRTRPQPLKTSPLPSPIATYSFHLDGCDASLVFSGAKIGSKDLDILCEHLFVIKRNLDKTSQQITS